MSRYVNSNLVVEGKAKIISSYKGIPIFYNPLAKLTRSLGVVVSAAYSEYLGRQLYVADALAATGIRGIRYTIESNVINKIFFNDKFKIACKIIKKNVEINNIKDLAFIENKDANLFMNTYLYSFDFIDIDPFGTPAPFIDNAVATVKKGGIVAVTATDLAPLCGLYPKSTLRKYGSLTIHTIYSKEIALRILIKEIIQACGRHMRYGNLLSSHVIYQYGRVYIMVMEGKEKYPYNQVGYIFHNLDSGEIRYCSIMRFKEFLSDISNKNILIAGPLWIGPLHDSKIIETSISLVNKGKVLSEDERLQVIKYLKLFRGEACFPPYHYNVHKVCKQIKIPVPKMERIIDGLKTIGYKATRTHFGWECIKTDADYKDFLYILKGL